MEMLRTAKADLCFGHLEIKGIEMQNGVIYEYGLAKSDFSRIEKVINNSIPLLEISESIFTKNIKFNESREKLKINPK